MVSGIQIATYADLHRHGYSIAYHCWRCQRWSDVDLAAIVTAGRGGQSYVRRRPRCIVRPLDRSLSTSLIFRIGNLCMALPAP